MKQGWKFFTQHQQGWLFSLLLLGIISWIAFLWHLGSTGLVDETEPLFAEAARQMLETGDWLTPSFNGETRFDKPPLIYWLIALGYQLIGVNEWAVRLPSALAAIALTVFCFFSLRYFGWATPAAAHSRSDRSLWLSAWLGSALVALNLQTIIWARTGVSDMLLSGCMGTALLCFFWGYARGSRRQEAGGIHATSFPHPWYLAFYILTALAVLTKGPVGAVLPGIIIGMFLLYTGRFWEVIREMGIIWGGLIFFCITLPWYVLIVLKHGSDYLNTFFGYHNFERFTNVVNGHSAPWYYYFLIVLGFLSPWSVYLPFAIFRLQFWQRFWWRKQPRYAQLGLFACCWFLGIFLFFSFSVTKLPSYILPLVPAAAILVALLFSDELTQLSLPLNQKKGGLIVSGVINVLLLLALAAAFVYSPELLGNDPAIEDESELLSSSGLPWRGGLTWGVTAVVCLVLLSRRRWHGWLIGANLSGLVALMIFTLVPFLFLVDQLRQLPIREIAVTLPSVQQQEEVWMVGFNKPSVVFYAHRPVKFFKTENRAIEYLEDQTVPPDSSDTVLIISRRKEIKELELKSEDYQKLDQSSVYLLIRVAKQKLLDANSNN